tara:strand:+ start:1080 stop:1382 length:303 start_codon:yes stop_codon:yes gene_type:complete
MTEQTRPTRLDIRDLPRDEKRVLGGLRAALVKSFNYVRRYPAKLAVLEETLRFVHGRVREEQTAYENAAKAAAKAAKAEAVKEVVVDPKPAEAASPEASV